MRDRVVSLTYLHSFLLLTAMFAFFSMIHVSYAEVINVPGDHPTIQEAIEAASVGDTINVSRRAGESQSVYYERLVINKELILVGESRETIIIDGGEAGTVIRIQADNVQIKGFTIRNGGSKYSGIRANGYSYVAIANNTVKANKHGVVFIYSNYNTVVQNLLLNNSATGVSLSDSIGNNVGNNDVSESAYGIKLSSANVTFVVDNTVTDNSYGIYLEHSSNDTVDENTLLRNGVNGIFPYACHDITVSNNEVSESAYGIRIHESDVVTVLGNSVMNNSYGIYLGYSGPSNTVESNIFSRNDWGVTLYSSSGNTFRGNMLSYNTFGVETASESNNNLFHHNNFDENTEQAVWNPDCVNTWDNDTQGNYWSDYTGTDSNGDGIGDTPYTIDPMNLDRYPLMNLWGIDVAVVDVDPMVNEGFPGWTVNISVTVQNEGVISETFNVTAYYDSNVIAVLQVTDLAPKDHLTLIFDWNTTEVSPGNYTISATAEQLEGETDLTDNSLPDGEVRLKILGDANDDGVVSVSDAVLLLAAFIEYDPNCDFNGDGVINLTDATILMSALQP